MGLQDWGSFCPSSSVIMCVGGGCCNNEAMRYQCIAGFYDSSSVQINHCITDEPKPLFSKPYLFSYAFNER